LAEQDDIPAHESELGADRWALRGINAIIKPGDKVGIIGSNGSGKSTLLNILAGITLPSGGYIQGHGLRVLLNSLRSPFRAQLTGRQNLHILAALLGVQTNRLEARIPEILAFSEMEKFIDRRVLHYSADQYQRLSFAAALMLEPEIILSDDTLGIGDARYRQRSEQLITDKVEKEGVIFIFASNNMNMIQKLCTRAIWLEQGRLAADGPAEQVIEAFLDADKGADDETAGEVEATGTVPIPSAPPPAAALAPRFEAGASEDSPLRRSKVPLPAWSQLVRNALQRRKAAERARIQKWNSAARKWLSAEKAFPSVPGLGELLDLRLDLGNSRTNGKSSLQAVIRLEKPGTEVSAFIDGVFDQTHVYSSELPQSFVAPARGLYFLTVNIDDVLLQPRIFERPYTKTKVRVKIYLREPNSEQWSVLSGIVRIRLQGEEWSPRIPYRVNRGPILKPQLEWDVEMSLDESAEDRSEAPSNEDNVLADSARRFRSG
jgi:ABC-type polysaccharide/polyol phosphate transport system ATPase subunit